MHTTPILVGVLSLLTAGASAARSAKCFTRYETTKGPRPIQTTTHTSYNTDCTSTRTITSTKTTTAPRSVSTVTVTSVTVSTATGVMTIQPRSDFSPIQDTLPGANYNPDDVPPGNQQQKRDLEDKYLTPRDTPPGLNSNNVRVYPNGVDCYVNGGDLCTKKTTTKTTTSTKPANPSAKTKVVLTTSTSTTYTQTSYAACATSNWASNVNGRQVQNIQFVTGQFQFQNITALYETVGDSNPYDCCVIAQTFRGGAPFWALVPGGRNNALGSKTSLCALYYTAPEGTCPAQDQTQFAVDAEYECYANLIVGNGPCGEFVTATVRNPSATPTTCTPSSSSTSTSTPAQQTAAVAKRGVPDWA